MKIQEVRVAGLRGATPEGGWTNELKPDDVVHTLVAVYTDEGPVGLGSVFTSEELVRGALSVLRPLLEGENALEPERVSEKLHQNTFWLGRGGSVTHAISGVDIALWDILGKVTGQPVGRLLGGRYRERVMPYASVLIEEPEPLAEHLIELREQGFRAVKIGWGPFGRRNAAFDESVVRAAREAVGDETFLMVDAGESDAFWNGNYKWALRTAHMLAAHDVTWFEEPLRPDVLEDYVALRHAVPVPVAGGEVLTRRQAFQPFIEAGAFDVVQPDVTKAGGLSEGRRVGWMAEENGVRMIPHGWNTAVGLAADLQLASAFAGTDLIEYKTGSPYIDEISTGDLTLDAEGMLAIPDTPGLGLDLNPEAVEHYSGDERLFRSP